ncbi:MAG: PAS domain S-box protein, partial [Candidatus Delongbacteria bacterium]|nr:PAS domain S-box protein [Candidatus Delongbacteria bacterium]
MENTLNILILEDNVDDLGLIKRELEKLDENIIVRSTDNRAEYIKFLNEELPNIVLSDYKLPDINGKESYDILRDLNSDIPFILVSGSIGEEGAIDLLVYGMNDYILKDNLKKLVPAIKREIKEYKNRLDTKIIQDKLIDSERNYRLMTTNTLDTIWRTDKEFNVTFVNDAIFELLRYTPEEFIGMSANTFVTAEGMKTIESVAKELTENYKNGKIIQSKFEVEQIRKDGSIIDVGLRANILEDDNGEFIGFQGRSVDITEQNKIQKELLRLSMAVEQSPNVVVLTDLSGNIIYANPRFTVITGYNLEEALGTNPRILKSGEMEDGFYMKLWEIVSSGKIWKGEMSNKKKDGTLYWEKAII